MSFSKRFRKKQIYLRTSLVYSLENCKINKENILYKFKEATIKCGLEVVARV